MFIARDNPEVAAQFGYKLVSKVDVLADFPEMGRVVPEIGATNIRELILRPYRIIYEVRGTQQIVAIVRLWHGSRGEPELYRS